MRMRHGLVVDPAPATGRIDVDLDGVTVRAWLADTGGTPAEGDAVTLLQDGRLLVAFPRSVAGGIEPPVGTGWFPVSRTTSARPVDWPPLAETEPPKGSNPVTVNGATVLVNNGAAYSINRAIPDTTVLAHVYPDDGGYDNIPYSETDGAYRVTITVGTAESGGEVAYEATRWCHSFGNLNLRQVSGTLITSGGPPALASTTVYFPRGLPNDFDNLWGFLGVRVAFWSPTGPGGEPTSDIEWADLSISAERWSREPP